MYRKIKNILTWVQKEKKRVLIVQILLFSVIVGIGMYLRYYHMYQTITFGWDQARDSWTVRDIIQGKLVLQGPKTGVGEFHLGPLYYYFLVPFFFLFHLDPAASLWFNILANSINFLCIFFVTKKMFSTKEAFFVLFLYSVSAYAIKQSQIPWNVSLVPGVSIWILYGIYQVYHHKPKWFLGLGALLGFFFHLHFTAVFVAAVIAISLFFVKEKKKYIWWMIGGVGTASVFFIPTILSEVFFSQSDYFRFRDFLSHYLLGIHPQFFLYRLPDALIQLQAFVFLPKLAFLKFIIPLVFLLVLFLKRSEQQERLKGMLLIPWFLVPWVGFSVYGGPISDYYFLLNFPMVLLMVLFLQRTLLTLYPKSIVLFIPLWAGYMYVNTFSYWIAPSPRGLDQQKAETRKSIQQYGSIQFNEGDIKAYLYVIWNEKK